jgi:hypothetical protein
LVSATAFFAAGFLVVVTVLLAAVAMTIPKS